MRAPGVVELNLLTDDPAGMLPGLEAMPVQALLFQTRLLSRASPSRSAAAVRRDELLLQAVAAYQLRVTATGENQAVIRTQQEGFRNTSQDAEPGNQCLLQGCLGSAGLATLRQVPTQQFPCMTVDTKATLSQPSDHPRHGTDRLTSAHSVVLRRRVMLQSASDYQWDTSPALGPDSSGRFGPYA